MGGLQLITSSFIRFIIVNVSICVIHVYVLNVHQLKILKLL